MIDDDGDGDVDVGGGGDDEKLMMMMMMMMMMMVMMMMMMMMMMMLMAVVLMTYTSIYEHQTIDYKVKCFTRDETLPHSLYNSHTWRESLLTCSSARLVGWLSICVRLCGTRIIESAKIPLQCLANTQDPLLNLVALGAKDGVGSLRVGSLREGVRRVHIR